MYFDVDVVDENDSPTMGRILPAVFGSFRFFLQPRQTVVTGFDVYVYNVDDDVDEDKDVILLCSNPGRPWSLVLMYGYIMWMMMVMMRIRM